MNQSTQYDIIAKAIQYLVDNQKNQPSLAELSAHARLSEYHFQRVFSEWVGVSPKQFLQYLTKEYAKQQLKNQTVLNAAYASGLSSSGRLHDLMIRCEGMTPGEYKKLGEGLTIYYGACASVFGGCFLATTDRGICILEFFDSNEELTFLLKEFQREWGRALLVEDVKKIETLANNIFSREKNKKQPLKLLLKGTQFQLKVWEALLTIPEGKLVSYQQIADAIQSPKAVRAAASAVARNNISYIIPCHRVIRQTGEFGQYRWNIFRKQAMIAWEACHTKSD